MILRQVVGRGGRPLGVAAAMVLGLLAGSAHAELYINEIYFDPPAGDDVIDEYVELRGAPGMSLENHYLIFLESEGNADDESPGPGGIDAMFDLGSFSLGSNGFLAILQKNNIYPTNPNASIQTNTGPNLAFGLPPGYGSGVNSTVGFSDDGNDGITENGAFSALLIRNDSGVAPSLSDDLDSDDDGNLDNVNGKAGWTILDSVGQAEPGEADAMFYAAINFTDSGNTGGSVTAGGTIVELPYEIEYLGRWGNSVGQTEDDWHVSNLTNNTGAGYTGRPDYRQARSDNHDVSDGNLETPAAQTGPGLGPIESNKGVPYGTPLMTTIGGPNYITGDFNGDGFVDAADYAVWRNSTDLPFNGSGTQGTELAMPAADANHDFLVDSADYDLWRANYGLPAGGAPSPGAGSGAVGSPTTVPEPHSVVLLLTLLTGFARRRR